MKNNLSSFLLGVTILSVLLLVLNDESAGQGQGGPNVSVINEPGVNVLSMPATDVNVLSLPEAEISKIAWEARFRFDTSIGSPSTNADCTTYSGEGLLVITNINALLHQPGASGHHFVVRTGAFLRNQYVVARDIGEYQIAHESLTAYAEPGDEICVTANASAFTNVGFTRGVLTGYIDTSRTTYHDDTP